MSKLLRYFVPGQTYIITAVTFRRRPLLVENFGLLMEAVSRTRERVEFEITTWVVLPDHIHAIVNPDDNHLSGIVRRVKLSFTNLYNDLNGRKSGTVWQRRFWDHIIRDQSDMNRHVDYIHYNPVKHGLIANPFRWRYSSLMRYLKGGYYARDRGVTEEPVTEGEFGE